MFGREKLIVRWTIDSQARHHGSASCSAGSYGRTHRVEDLHIGNRAARLAVQRLDQVAPWSDPAEVEADTAAAPHYFRCFRGNGHDRLHAVFNDGTHKTVVGCCLAG